MSDTVKCPYCRSRVSVRQVETEDGTCPECGAVLMGSFLFGAGEDEEELVDNDVGSDAFDAGDDLDFDDDDIDEDDEDDDML